MVEARCSSIVCLTLVVHPKLWLEALDIIVGESLSMLRLHFDGKNKHEKPIHQLSQT